MIDFTFTENQLAVRDIARGIAQNVIAPSIKEFDRNHTYNPELLPAMAKANLMGFCIPEKYGGLGTDYISLGLACEELEYADTSARVVLSVHLGLFCMSILAWANEEQKQKYLIPAAKGEKIATFGLTEPGAGSDVRGIQTTAVKNGDHYVLNGEKMWISLAAVADQFLIFAWTDLEKKKQRIPSGISAFIVESAWDGVTTGSIKGKLGVRAGNTGWISMQDAKVPVTNLVHEEGFGFKMAMFCLDQGRYTVAAGSCGLIKACLDSSVKYCHERKTFETPIGDHQLVKQMIAQMERGYESSRYLWMKAGVLKNEGKRNTRETAMAKWVACDEAERAAYNAVQIHGSYGYSDEYPVERFFRNSKGAAIYEGTREIQTLLQADYALGNRIDKDIGFSLPTVSQE